MGLKDFFVSYSDQLQPTKNAIEADNISEAKKLTPVRDPDHNAYSLSLLENGRVNFLANDWAVSKKDFTQADKIITQYEDQAKIQISKGIKKLGALASNDTAIPYEVAYYEKSMLHTYQALNYLYQKDLEGALVEVRRANLVQTKALSVYEDEIIEAKDDMSKAGVDFDKVTGSYPSMSEVIGSVKNGFQNAYTFYLSGVLYEAIGEPNDAYIDYKKALEIYPNNKYLQQDILRLATRLGMQDDLARYKQQYGDYSATKGNTEGEVVFIYEDGLVNSKDDVSLNLPIFTSGDDLRFFSFSLPVYKNDKSRVIPLNVEFESKNYASEEIVKIQSLAAKNLHDQLPALITRQALRIVAKEQVRKQASKESDLANVLASLYNLASEKADTRSWSTLPARVGIVRMSMAGGEHGLTVKAAGKRIPLNIKVTPNRITLINISGIGHYTNYQVHNL